MPPALSDGRLRLVPLPDARPDAFAEATRAAAGSVTEWLTAAFVPTEPDDVAAFVALWEREAAQGTGMGYAVERLADGRVVGFGFLNHVLARHRFCNLGYWVRPDAEGQGVATAVTRMLAHVGFVQLGLARIEIVMDPENVASRRVAEKAGARFEGRLRNRLSSDRGVRDGLMFSLVPADLGL